MPYHFHLIALALYGAATALALAPFAGRPAVPRGLLLAVPSAGAAFHVAGLVQMAPAGLAFGPGETLYVGTYSPWLVAFDPTGHASEVAGSGDPTGERPL